jgi:exonuclease III
MQFRKTWDNEVLEHCSCTTSTHSEKSFVCGGDLNVLPRIEDVDRGAFSNLRQTLPPGATPGRSHDDLAAYSELLEKTGMINVKAAENPVDLSKPQGGRHRPNM